MSSLKADFDELRVRIRHGREVGHAGFEPIYYLVFPPSRILAVKRQTPAWIAKLRQDGWQVHRYSLAEAIWTLAKADPLWGLCVDQDRLAPLDWPRASQSIADILTTGDVLLKHLETKLDGLADQPHALLLVTELETLHPYLRIGAIESKLQGRRSVPMIFLYPGLRTGKTSLKFLGFYPADGNYRSVHVGG